MADVARHLGTSTATVSLSLRNHRNISPATRERVRAAAVKLGYRPNPLVSALMRWRRLGRASAARPVLAVVCGLNRPEAWRESPSHTRRAIRLGAFERAAELGYHAQEFWLNPAGMSAQRFSDMLAARGIRGLLLGPLADGMAPPLLGWSQFAAVSLSVPFLNLPLHAVCNDHFFSCLRAMHQCHALGYRRPGLVIRRAHRPFFQGRLEGGFLTAHSMLPDFETLAPLLLDHGDDPKGFPLPALRRWLDRHRPDVILTLDGNLIEQQVKAAGRRVPAEIGIASLSVPEAGHRMSGIYQNGRRIGATGVDVVVAKLERNEYGLPDQPLTTMIEGTWNPGRTLRLQRRKSPARK